MMIFSLFLAFCLLSNIPISLTFVYEESFDDMLIQCNNYQQELYENSPRVAHECEKEDPDEDFSYYITAMITKYGKLNFLCVLLFKAEDFKLDLKLLFSHENYTINSVREHALNTSK
jgi:hypothetical protein